MKFQQEQSDNIVINAYEPGGITVDKQTYQHSLIISPTNVYLDWPVSNIENLQAEHFNQIIELKPEILLLGVGDALTFPDSEILAAVHAARIGVEIMDNAAACRTYNILAGEDRNVVVAIILTTH
tara:strand:+ start:17475 stop:17849 length:375 start_codon:yes stop_codon:yes gene_type:complete